MSLATLTCSPVLVSDIAEGDLITDPSPNFVGVFAVRHVVEGTDVDTDEECVIVVFDHGSLVLAADDVLYVVTG